MNRKIWKALGIAVCMLALAAPRAMAVKREVRSDDDFKKAIEEINQSGDTENEIVLMENITLGGNYINYILTNDKTTTIKTTTIKGEGHTIFVEPNAGITVTGKGNVLNLGAEGYKGTLTIDRDPRDGSVPETRGAFITVSGGATAKMYENVTLQNWQFAGNACVVIMGSNSVFNMDGGVIENCSRAVTVDSGTTFNMSGGEIRNREGIRGSGNGGGVRVYGATFVMSGGTISGCSADTGGGLYAKNQSTITIEGGTISGCKALSLDKGNGGGLYVEGSTLTIERGTISGCTARNNGGGLYVDGSTITIEDGTISGCKALSPDKGNGGGLYAKNKSTITINKSTISGCTAEMNNGGGLYAENSTIEITDGTISECMAIYDGGGLYAKNKSTITINKGTISGCKGRWGGGLYAENSLTITITDSTISGCKAGAGGGLFVNGSALNIKDGTISECFVSDSGKGGGLYAENNSILTISGGTIKGNKAAYGGGVALVKSKVKVEEPITNWTVVDNEAYKTDTGRGYIGGGIYLESGSMDVSNGSNKIYNNTADGHGADICLTDKTSSIKLPNAANMNVPYHNSGINIDGWYKDDNPRYMPSEDGKAETSLQLSGQWSLVASYKAIPMRTVKIDTNGGVGGSSSQTVQKGTTVTLEAPTKEGHLFKGWEDEKGNSYPAGEDGKVKITVNEDMKLKAVWEARTFTVTYILLDGKTRTETAAYGETVTLVEEPRTGYTFVGWKDGEKVHQAGKTITVTGNVTLTAVWEARSFTVTYVLLNGKTRTETAAYGKTVTLVEEPRTGYTFVGWKDGEKVRQAGETITVTGNVTLTAVWKAKSFTVTYVLLDGKTRTETAAYGQDVTLVEEPRTGYTFVGWKDGENVYHAGETITVTGDMTLTAEWKKLPSAENLPKTGDESPVLLWGAALAVSAAACFMLRRRK